MRLDIGGGGYWGWDAGAPFTGMAPLGARRPAARRRARRLLDSPPELDIGRGIFKGWL